MSTETQTEATTAQTIVVQVQPAPADPENVQRYIDISMLFLGIIIVLALWKKTEHLFNTNDTY